MKKNRFFPIFGMIVGIGMIIAGIAIQDLSIGIWVNSLQFGADFYTESHHATAAAATNVHHLCEILRASFTALLCLGGLFDICYFGCKLTEKKADAPKMPTVIYSAPAAPSESTNNTAESSETSPW